MNPITMEPIDASRTVRASGASTLTDKHNHDHIAVLFQDGSLRVAKDDISNTVDAHYASFPDNHSQRTGIAVVVEDFYPDRVRTFEDQAPTIRADRSGLKVVTSERIAGWSVDDKRAIPYQSDEKRSTVQESVLNTEQNDAVSAVSVAHASSIKVIVPSELRLRGSVTDIADSHSPTLMAQTKGGDNEPKIVTINSGASQHDRIYDDNGVAPTLQGGTNTGFSSAKHPFLSLRFRTIQLTRGLETVVDQEDYERLSQFKWYADYMVNSKKFRAVRNTYENGVHKRILMHREIMGGLDSQEQVDHISGDTLDNRKSNLRVCVNSENSCNRKLRSDSTSGFKGVSWNKNRGKYGAYINHDGKRFELGFFDSAIEAASAYNEKAVELHGEFARLNLIPEPSNPPRLPNDSGYIVVQAQNGKSYVRLNDTHYLAIRRLTPIETNRLMSWPDDYLDFALVPKCPKKKCLGCDPLTGLHLTKQSDSSKYKQCGNGIVSTVVQAVYEQLLKIMTL